MKVGETVQIGLNKVTCNSAEKVDWSAFIGDNKIYAFTPTRLGEMGL